MDEITISPAGDPFTSTPRREHDHPHGCYEGWVYLGRMVEDPESGEEVEVIEAIPCRRYEASVCNVLK